MDTKSSNQIDALQKMRLPELWARFAEVVGEENRSPNKTFLIRRISEALDAAETEPAAAPKRPARPKTPKTAKATKKKESTTGSTTEAITEDTALSKLSVAELQNRYADQIGRPTGSCNSAYLIWKIRQAQKGRIPIGPSRRRTGATPGDFKVLPLRMETETVDQLDAARERLGLKSRTELIRRALRLFLDQAGENDVAALLE